MPDHQQVPSDGLDANPAFRMFLAWLAFLAVVLALALGMSWKELLHWIGEALLIIGILLAAQGISQVRREWTRRPGIWAITAHNAHLVRSRAAAFLWLRWNRALERWPRLAERLHFRIHVTHVHLADAGAAIDAVTHLEASATVHVGPAPADATVEKRLANLETRLADAVQQLDALEIWRGQADRRWATELGREWAEREVGDQSTRERIADYAGGGLRLQAWGVVCLLAGTVMTALW